MSLEARVAALETLVASFNRGSFSYIDLVSKERERAWTPVLTAGTPGNLSVTYSTQVGRYTRIGGMVWLYFNIETSAFSHTTASGDVQITGLPFTAKTDTGVTHLGAMVISGWNPSTSYTEVTCKIDNATSVLKFLQGADNTAIAEMQIGDLPTGGTPLLAADIFYRAA